MKFVVGGKVTLDPCTAVSSRRLSLHQCSILSVIRPPSAQYNVVQIQTASLHNQKTNKAVGT
jgi:hypothetical protein